MVRWQRPLGFLQGSAEGSVEGILALVHSPQIEVDSVELCADGILQLCESQARRVWIVCCIAMSICDALER